VSEIAKRFRVGADKVRAWIRRRELLAVNTANVVCARPRWIITPEALADFERRRASGPAPKPARRKRQPLGSIDYYPDDHAAARPKGVTT
jgi:hypothetical protein